MFLSTPSPIKRPLDVSSFFIRPLSEILKSKKYDGIGGNVGHFVAAPPPVKYTVYTPLGRDSPMGEREGWYSKKNGGIGRNVGPFVAAPPPVKYTVYTPLGRDSPMGEREGWYSKKYGGNVGHFLRQSIMFYLLRRVLPTGEIKDKVTKII